MEEIDQLREEYGENILIQFEDDNILIQRDRAKELFRKLAQRHVKWAIYSGVMIKLLDEEMIVLMKESGCQQLNLALESGNETVLKAMKKPMDLEHAEKVVGWCAKHNVETLSFLMVGYPGETDETWAQTLSTLRRLRKLGLGKVAPFIVNAHPGTPLYSEAVENGWLINSEESVMNGGLIQLRTEDFDEVKVSRWMESIEEVMHPYKWLAKKSLRKLMPGAGYRNLVTLIRKTRTARQAVN